MFGPNIYGEISNRTLDVISDLIALSTVIGAMLLSPPMQKSEMRVEFKSNVVLINDVILEHKKSFRPQRGRNVERTFEMLC